MTRLMRMAETRQGSTVKFHIYNPEDLTTTTTTTLIIHLIHTSQSLFHKHNMHNVGQFWDAPDSLSLEIKHQIQRMLNRLNREAVI